jgi:hypothetical protein
MDFHNVFNQKLLEFSRDLCDVFPSNSEFQKLQAGVVFLQNLEPKTLEKYFYKYFSSKFREQLLNKDERFFIEQDNYVTGEDYWKNLVNQLKEIWKSLSQENKDIIWKYFRILIVLSDKCNNL